MNITKEMLIEEIKVLQKAAQLHAQKSIEQYKNVVRVLEELEQEKQLLEEKVKKRTKHLDKLAKYDVLTQLPNRYLFKEQLRRTLKSSKLSHKPFTLIFIDLDGFKDVNDTYGHYAGDILLKKISQKLLGIVREESDTVSRLGGDEFTILLPGLKNQEQIDKITHEILRSVNATKNLTKNIKINISASIGIYIYDNDYDITIDEIIANADIAMYQAKEAGKNRHVYFNQKMKLELSKQITLKQELLDAFEADEFVNYLQPIVQAKTHKIVGVEVLLRWKKENSIVSPAYFIETLENMDLIFDVTFWQIESILSKVQAIKQELFFSFNLTAKILHTEKIVDFLTYIKEHYAVSPSNIYLEITESDFSKDIQKTKNVLAAISKLGFKISLDDFGTGYSSLSYIRDFQIDILKIDQAFVKGIENSKKDYKLFQSIMHMGKVLDMKIVVEGVETKKQLTLIGRKKIVKIQGYYFYKPMPLQEFLSLGLDKMKKCNTKKIKKTSSI